MEYSNGEKQNLRFFPASSSVTVANPCRRSRGTEDFEAVGGRRRVDGGEQKLLGTLTGPAQIYHVGVYMYHHRSTSTDYLGSTLTLRINFEPRSGHFDGCSEVSSEVLRGCDRAVQKAAHAHKAGPVDRYHRSYHSCQ